MGWEEASNAAAKVQSIVLGVCYVVYISSLVCSFIYIFCKYKRKDRQSWITLFLTTALCNLILITVNTILNMLDIWDFNTAVKVNHTKLENFYDACIQMTYFGASWIFI